MDLVVIPLVVPLPPRILDDGNEAFGSSFDYATSALGLEHTANPLARASWLSALALVPPTSVWAALNSVLLEDAAAVVSTIDPKR